MESVVLVADIKDNADNTEAAFTTKLARPLYLPGQWRASIMDISYPHLWTALNQNLTYGVLMVVHQIGETEYDQDSLISPNQPLGLNEATDIRTLKKRGITVNENELFDDARCIRFTNNDTYEFVTAAIDEGDVTDAKILIKHLDSTILTLYRKLYPLATDVSDIVIYKANSRNVKFRNLEHARYLIVAPAKASIISMMGHKPRSTMIKTPNNREIEVLPVETSNSSMSIYRKRNKLPAIETILSLRPLDNVFIYTDLVEQSLIGESQANLLGYFPIKSNYGETGYWCFNPPYDYRVLSNRIDTISIKLTHLNGELFPFRNGKIIIRLLFKRVQ